MSRKLTKAKIARMQRARQRNNEANKRDQIDGVGFIESVYGRDTSFNVNKLKDNGENGGFYKSAYTLKRAKQYLQELLTRKEQKKDVD